MPDHDTKVSQEQNVPQDANRQQGTGIKNTANGITAAKYYTARMADYTRRFAEVDFSDPDAVIPSEPSDAEIQIRYMEMSDDELTAEYEKLLQDNTYLWEYSSPTLQEPLTAVQRKECPMLWALMLPSLKNGRTIR